MNELRTDGIWIEIENRSNYEIRCIYYKCDHLFSKLQVKCETAMLTSLDSAELNNFDLVYSFCIAFAVFVLGFFLFCLSSCVSFPSIRVTNDFFYCTCHNLICLLSVLLSSAQWGYYKKIKCIQILNRCNDQLANEYYF